MAVDDPAGEGGDGQPQTEIDRGVYLEIVRTFAKAPRYTQESLRTDRDLVLKVVREHREGWRLIKGVTADLRADRELLFATIKGSVMGWRAMAFAAPELREDRELCVEAVRRNAAALELLAPELRQDRELVSEALTSISRRLQAAPQPKHASQDWDRLTSNHAPVKTPRRKRGSHVEAATGDHNEEWTERLRREEEGPGGVPLHMDDDRGSCRVVPLMCLRIQQQNGLVLAVLGKVESDWAGQTKARCVLPATRIMEGEQPRDTLSRFLQSTLFAPLAKALEVDSDFQVHAEECAPNEFDLQTRYVRSVFKASIDPKFQWNKVARRISVCPVRSPRGRTQKLNLARRFGTGASKVTPPLPPDMYVLRRRECDFGYGQLPPLSRTATLYSWIPAWEYDWLRNSDTGRETLKAWLANIDVSTAFDASTSVLDSQATMLRNASQIGDLTESACSSRASGNLDGFIANHDRMPALFSPKQKR